jgi:hypothetical protein
MAESLPGDESKILGVSIRGWLAVLMTMTVCVMSAFKTTITEPLYSGFLMGLGFYLGQKTK